MDVYNLLTTDKSPRTPGYPTPVQENTPLDQKVENINPQEIMNPMPFSDQPPRPIIKDVVLVTNEVSKKTPTKIRYKQYPKKTVPTIMPNPVFKEITISKPPEKFAKILNPITEQKDEIDKTSTIFYPNNASIYLNINSILPINLEQPSIIENNNNINNNNNIMLDESSETEEEVDPKFPITQYLSQEILHRFDCRQSKNFVAELLVMKMHSLLDEFIKKNPQKASTFIFYKKFLIDLLYYISKIRFNIPKEKNVEIYIKQISDFWPKFYNLSNSKFQRCSKQERINNYEHARNIDVYKECLSMFNKAFSNKNEIASWLYTDLDLLIPSENEYNFEANLLHIKSSFTFINAALDHYLKVIDQLIDKTKDEQFINWLQNLTSEIETYKDNFIGKMYECLNSKEEVQKFIKESSKDFKGQFELKKYAKLPKTIRIFTDLLSTINSSEFPLRKLFEQINNLENPNKDVNLSYLKKASFKGFLFNAALPFLKMSSMYFNQLNIRFQKARENNNNNNK